MKSMAQKLIFTIVKKPLYRAYNPRAYHFRSGNGVVFYLHGERYRATNFIPAIDIITLLRSRIENNENRAP